jgi:hypothetical protein
MNKRTLKDGSQVDSYDKPIDLIIHTKAPAKWKLIDLETGQEYLGSEIPHGTFAEVLRNKVLNGIIGSWFKTKGMQDLIYTYGSWVLAVIGVAGIYFVGRKDKWGWNVLLFNEALWITYAIITKQYGFIVSALAYAAVYIRSYIHWSKEPVNELNI